MKIRNKKTGEIATVEAFGSTEGEIQMTYTTDNDETKLYLYCTPSLTTFNEEWEDYEGPKEHWCITMYGGITRIKDDEEPIDDLIEIGNYFNSKEDAYDAWEKLKAWKRLKDKGFKFDRWENDNEKYLGDFVMYAHAKDLTDIIEDLDLLFGGEE